MRAALGLHFGLRFRGLCLSAVHHFLVGGPALQLYSFQHRQVARIRRAPRLRKLVHGVTLFFRQLLVGQDTRLGGVRGRLTLAARNGRLFHAVPREICTILGILR